jgi:hypothetical protein
VHRQAPDAHDDRRTQRRAGAAEHPHRRYRLRQDREDVQPQAPEVERHRGGLRAYRLGRLVGNILSNLKLRSLTRLPLCAILSGASTDRALMLKSNGGIQIVVRSRAHGARTSTTQQKGSRMQSRVRLMLAGLVALLALSSILSAPAFAGPGPFWRQREDGSTQIGVKISPQSPEKFQAKSGPSTLIGLTAGKEGINTIVICENDRAGGIIYNGKLQGQGKIKVAYENCTTNLKGCAVKQPIIFSANFHLMWKYQGKPEELEPQKKQQSLGQVPDLLFYTGEVEEGAKTLEEKEFVKIAFEKNNGAECLAAIAPIVVKGFESATITPEGVEKWSKTTSIGFTPGPHEQHFWNGVEQVALTTSLKFGSNSALFESQDEVGPYLTQSNNQQEVAVYEN